MAEEVEMTPVEMTPVDAVEPPKVNPLAKPTVSAPAAGLKLPPKPALAPGLKLPPKPGATVSALKPGLKLPPKPGATVSALKPGLKLPPKPGVATTGLKLPPKPGATIIAKPVIRKPGEASAALPKPLPKPVVPVDAQGVGKLPTVEAKAMGREEATAAPVEAPKPLEALKSVTQKLKGLTQPIPAQAILHKTGIISEAAQTEAQKEAAKHKTARISLSDAMGVAPVKSEPAPMKTIRIKRPVNLPGSTSAALAPQARPAEAAAPAAAPAPAAAAAPAPTPAPEAEASATSVTQRKTLKITRPGTAVRPSGKFAVKKPATQATTIAKKPAGDDVPPLSEGEVADIPDLPPVTAMPLPQPAVEAKPGVGTTLAVVVQLAASFAVAALLWFFYENSQLPTYCGGLGWGQ